MFRGATVSVTADAFMNNLLPRLAKPSSHCIKCAGSGFSLQQRRFLQNTVLIKPTSYTSSTTIYDERMARLLEKGHINNIFRVCKDMTDKNINPDLTTYNIIMKAFSRVGMVEHAEALLKEMKDQGFQPDIHTYTALIYSYAKARDVPKTLQLLDEELPGLNLKPVPLTYESVIHGAVESNQLEWGLELLERFKSQVTLTQRTYRDMVYNALTLEEPDLAFQLLMEGASNTMKEMPPSVYCDVLRSTSFNYKIDETRQCWNTVVHTLQAVPDEGLCIDILHCAGAFGDVDLAEDVVRVLQRKNVILKDYHLASLLEAYAKQGDVVRAFGIISSIHENNIETTDNIANPIIDCISKSSEDIDEAWRIVTGMHDIKKSVPSIAVKAVLRGCSKIQDLGRAMAFHRQSLQWDDIEPDVSTYNLLLSLCVQQEAAPIGDRLIEEMKDRGINFDNDTFNFVIALKITQTNYEEAFKYLEELKARDVIPPRYIYLLIIRRCAKERDSRAYLAIEEMEAFNYSVPPALLQHVKTAGEDDFDDYEVDSDHEFEECLRRDEAARMRLSREKKVEWLRGKSQPQKEESTNHFSNPLISQNKSAQKFKPVDDGRSLNHFELSREADYADSYLNSLDEEEDSNMNTSSDPAFTSTRSW